MAVNEIPVWAECNDGHTTLAGINVDELTIGEIFKWAGVIPWCSQKEHGGRKMKRQIKFRAWEEKAKASFDNATAVYRHMPVGMLTNLFQKLAHRNELKGYGALPFTLGDFQTWAMNSPEFLRLFNLWVADDYSKKSKPSVDRINPYRGYEFRNMQWLSWNENYIKGIAEVSEKKHKPVVMLKDGVEVGKFKSVKDAQYFLGLKSNGDITMVLQGKRNTVKGYTFIYEHPELLEDK